jgi:general stress protein 26
MQKTKPSTLNAVQRKKIIGFLASHPVGVLATVDAAGDPCASTIYIGVDADLNITFTTKRDTAKHTNISKHPAVTLVVFDAPSQAMLQISGKAVEQTNPEAAQTIYKGTLHAAQRTGEDVVPPVAKIAAGPYIAYVIHTDNIRMSEYGWGDSFARALNHAKDSKSSGDPA